MKVSTMVAYIQNQMTPAIAEGWESGANFEVALQVKLDSIVRTHLSAKVGLSTPTRHANSVNVQKAGKGNATGSALITAAPNQLARTNWSKMREIAYSQGNQIADLMARNHRFVVNPTVPNALTYKDTTHWIELKVESPQTNKFGGVSLKRALEDDFDKLWDQMKWDGGSDVAKTAFAKRRYWVMAIAISEAERGKMLSYAYRTKEWIDAGSGLTICLGYDAVEGDVS
jgi:hypothetical protein